MGVQDKIKAVAIVVAVAMVVVVVTSGPARAATMSASFSAPVIDGEDIASYGTQTGSDKWWPGSSTAYGNPGKTVGQTFTTGGMPVVLNAFTFQIVDDRAIEPTKEYTIRVGTVDGSTFTEIHTETATQDFATAENENWWTWTLDTPVLLSANTVYGVDVGLNSSTSEWTTGIPYVKVTADEYPDGTRFRSGTEGSGVGDESMTHTSGDRIFHIDLSSADPNIPDVDAGVDMVSWSGQPVQLDPNVVVPPGSDWTNLTYAWSAEPADGVEFSDPNSLAPTVTITKETDNPSVVTLTLAVNNEGRTGPPATDSMTIDVYDDGCIAALSLGLTELDPTDIDGDCATAFSDFALLAATWLDDYALTEPAPK